MREHGSYRGAMQHYRAGEDECDACANARREYAARGARIRRNRSKQARQAIEQRALLRLANRYPNEYAALIKEERRKGGN